MDTTVQTAPSVQMIVMKDICIDRRIIFAEKPKIIIDFTTMKVFNQENTSVVSVYVGHHPDISKENRKYIDDEFRMKLRKPMKYHLSNGDIIGVQNGEFGIYYHIYAQNKDDVEWVSKYINFCSQFKKRKN